MNIGIEVESKMPKIFFAVGRSLHKMEQTLVNNSAEVLRKAQLKPSAFDLPRTRLASAL